MAEWWEASPLAPPETNSGDASGWWQGSPRAAEPLIPSRQPGQGTAWPTRQGATGIQFDPYAGVLGSIMRGITNPYDVFAGNIPTPYSPGAGATPSSDVMSRATESASLMSPMSPSYRAGARYGTVTPLADDAWLSGWRGNLTKPPISPPSAGDIKTAANAGYTSVRESGLETPSGPLSTLAGDIRNAYGERFSPESAKSTFNRLDMMQNPKRSGTSMADLMAHHDDLTAIIGRGGPDAVAAIEARTALRQFIDNLGTGNTRAMPGVTPTMAAEDVAPTLATARGNTRSAIAANKISGELDPAATGFIERAEGHAGPGRRPVAMQLSDRAEAILKNNKEISSFAPDEIKALELIRDGTATRNTLEWFGRRFGGTDLASTLANFGVGGAGYAGSGWKGALAGLVTQGGGLLAKAAANAISRGQTRAAEELVRRNSPLGQSLLDAQKLSYSPGIGRDQTVMRALMPGLLETPPEQRRLPPGYI